MNIKECPEKYKQYEMIMNDGSKYEVSGESKENIINATKNFITLASGNTINKAYIVQFKINMIATRECVQEHADEIKNSLVTT